jgi:hypothetical protein
MKETTVPSPWPRLMLAEWSVKRFATSKECIADLGNWIAAHRTTNAGPATVARGAASTEGRMTLLVRPTEAIAAELGCRTATVKERDRTLEAHLVELTAPDEGVRSAPACPYRRAAAVARAFLAQLTALIAA